MKKRLFTSVLMTLAALFLLPSATWADTETWDFTNLTNNSGQISSGTATINVNNQDLFSLSSGDTSFGNRFAIGPSDRTGSNGFYFKNWNTEKGLYSQYENRYFAIRNLKNGDKITIVWTAGGTGGSLKFSGTPSLTGDNLTDVAVTSNKEYTASADCNLLMVTAKESDNPNIYISSVTIKTAEDNKPTIEQTAGTNIVTITAKSGFTTYYTLDGNDPTTSSASFTETTKTLVLGDNCTVKAYSVKDGVTGGTIVTDVASLSYTRPTATAYGKYDFTALVNSSTTRVLAENPTASINGNYYLKSTTDNVFDYRFTVGPTNRQDSGNGLTGNINGWVFEYKDATYKGLFAQYDNRKFSIIDLKDGDMYVITTSNNQGTLGIESGKLYTKSGNGNVDLTTTGSVYVESVVIGNTSSSVYHTITEYSANGNTVTAKAGALETEKVTVTITTASGYAYTDNSLTIKNGDANVSYTSNGDGTYTFVMPAGNVSLSASFTSTTTSIAEATVNLDKESFSYTGEAQKPTVSSVVLNETTLSSETDYDVSVEEKTVIGNYTLTVTGKGSYSGTVQKNWSIGRGVGSVSYATAGITKTVGDAAFTNELTKVGDGTVTYSISDGGTGTTINTSTGEVTVGSTAGTATITATVTNGTNYDYATTTATYTLTVNAKPAEDAISTMKTWTFDNYNVGDYYVSNSNSYKAVDGLYVRSLSGRNFVITESTLNYTFSDGTSGSVTKYAKISGTYSGYNSAVTSAAQNSGYLTPFFAFNTTVAGTCYAYVKSSGESNQNVRIYYTSGNGSFDCPSGAYTTSNTAREIKLKASAGGSFFIGSTTNAVGEIYAIRFVPTHTLTSGVDPTGNATITMKDGSTAVDSGTSIEEGKTITIEVSGIASGYEIDHVKVNGGDALTATNGKYSFTMPTADATVKVTLKKKSYTLTAATVDNGSISFTVSGAAATTAEFGDEVTIISNPNANYQLSTLTGTYGTESTALSITDNKFTMPDGDVTITATFVSTAVVPTTSDYGTFTFTGLGDSDGIVPNWGATLSSGTLQMLAKGNETFGNRFAAGPVNQNNTSNCFKFKTNSEWDGLYSQYDNRTFSIINLKTNDQVTITMKDDRANLKFVDGNAVENGKAYLVDADGDYNFVTTGETYIQSVKVVKTFNISISSLTNGSITADKERASEGETVTLTVTPEADYQLKEGSLKATYNDGNQNQDITITDNKFTMPDANVTVTATFVENSTPVVTSSYWTYNYAQMAVAMKTADNSKSSITWTRNTNSKTTVNSKDMYPVYIDGYQSEGNLLADRGDGILKFGDVYNIGLTNNANATNYYAIKNVKANDIIEIVYNGGGTSSAMNTLPALENLNNATVSNETSSYTLKFNYGNKDRTLDYTVKTLTVTADGPVSFSLKDGYIAKITVGTAYTVNANVTQESYGTVSVTSPDYMLLGDKFIKGTDVTLKAEPAAGKEFVKWTDGSNDVSTANPYTITNLSANTTLTAVFQESTVMYNIKVTAGANGSVTVTKGSDNVTSSVTGVSGQDYVTGTSLTLTATADPGYKFKNWTNSGGAEVSTENPYTISLTEAMGLTANFEESTEETVGTKTMWTFNSMAEVATQTTGISVIQNGLYNRSASSGRGFTIKSESVSGLKFSDGTSVGDISYVAFSDAKAYVGNMKNLTAGASSDDATPYFAFNASVAGICYALVKNGTGGKSRINFGKGDGTAIANVESKKTDVIEELSYTSSEPGVFFIGGAADNKERTIYAIRFVPLTELPTPILSVSTADHGTVTAKINTTTVEEGGNTDVTTGSKVTLTVTPDDGYELDQLVTTGGATISSDKSFTMPSTNVTISATFKAVSSETPTEEVKEYGTVVDASNATVTGVEIGEKTTTVSISGTINGIPVTSITDDTFTAENTANVGAIDLSETKINLTGNREEIPALQNINSATLVYMPSTANVTGTNVITSSGTCTDYQVFDSQLSNGKPCEVPKTFTADKATLNRTFRASQKCTVCLPYSFARTGGKFYKFVGISGGKVQMAEQTTDMLEANTPYIFEPSAIADGITTNTGTIAVSISDAPNTEVSSASFTFKGTYEKIEWTNPTGIYGFAAEDKDGATVGSFVRVGAGASIMACRAYLEYTGTEPINGVAATRGMTDSLPAILEIEWIPAEKGSTTGINRTELQNDDDAPVYNISGQRVDSSYKGLVIKNGKKVVRK